MRFSARGLTLRADQLASQRELRQALARIPEAVTLLMGTESSQFFLLQVERGGATLAVGLCVEGEPQVHLVDAEHLLLGFGTEVLSLHVPDGAVVWHCSLGSPFREMLELESLDRLLVIHEFGAVCLSPEGEELWRYDKDLVEHFAIKRESLILRFQKAPGVRLDLLTGEWR